MPVFKIVIIDWGNTLCATSATYKKISPQVPRLFVRHGAVLSPTKYRQLSAAVRRELREELPGDVRRHALGAHEKRIMEHLGLKIPLQQARRLDLGIFGLFLRRCKLRPGAKLFLRRLKKKNTKLYLVSNSSERKLMAEVKKLGLVGYFEKIISSEGCGHEKSSRIPFKLAFEDATRKGYAANPKDFVVIGDREEEDGAARALGIKVFLVGKSGTNPYGNLEKRLR